jgi:hypothetical protein
VVEKLTDLFANTAEVVAHGKSTALVLRSTTDPEMQSVVPIETLTQEELQQARAVENSVDFTNGTMLLLFGADAQNAHKEQILELLKGVKAGDLGITGDLAASLHAGIDILDIEKMQEELTPSSGFSRRLRFWSNFPWVGPMMYKWMSSVYRFKLRQDEFVTHIRKAEQMATNDMIAVNEYVNRMDTHQGNVEENFRQLKIRVAGGDLALKRGADEYRQLVAGAVESGDAIVKARTQRFGEEVRAFDDRVLNLKTQYVRAPISIERVQQLQAAGRQEIHNIMNGLLTELPNLVEAALDVAGLASLERAQQRRQAMSSVSARIGNLRDDLMDRTYDAAMKGRDEALERINRLKTHMESVNNRMARAEKLRKETEENKIQADAVLMEIQRIFAESQECHMLPGEVGR